MKNFRFSGEHPNKSQIPQKNPAAECMIMGLECQSIDIKKLLKPKRKFIGVFNGLEVYKDEDAISNIIHGGLFPLVSCGLITNKDKKSYNINVERAIRQWEATPENSIMDPCMGSGNLLVAAIFVGFNPKHCFGVEIDKEIYDIAVARLTNLGVPKENLVNDDILKYLNN